MPNLKKITGNYIQVTDLTGLPAEFYAPQSLEEYNEQIDKDLHRMAYLSFDHPVSYIKEKLRDSSHLPTDESRSFTQGNFEGGTFNRLIIDLSPQFDKVRKLALAEGTENEGRANDIRVAYIDDDGNHCALSIGYLRDDPDVAKGEEFVPVEQRKRLFSVCIIKNTNLAPADRTVTLLTHPVFVSESLAKNSSDVEEQDVAKEVNSLLNSKKFSTLLTDMFDGEALSASKFDDLRKRIQQNRNIDNRDFKQDQLKELNDWLKSLLPDDRDVRAYMAEINERASSDINFFKDDNYNKTLDEIFKTISSAGKELAPEQQEEILIKSQLTYIFMKLELKSFEVDLATNAGKILADQYQNQAKLLRGLRDNPTGEEKQYLEKGLEQLLDIFDTRVPKILKLQQFIKNEQKKYNNNEVLEHLKEIENDLMANIDSYTEASWAIKLDSSSDDVEKFVVALEEKDTPILKEKLQGFARQLKDHAATLSDSDEDLAKRILTKAGNLSNLSYIESIPYKKLDFSQVLSNVMREINDDKLKEDIVHQLKQLGESLTEQDPLFLKKRIMERAAELDKESTKEVLALGRDFKKVSAEMITGFFNSERISQKQIIRAEAKKEIEALPIPSVPSSANQNWFQRNRNSLIVGGVGLLAVISLVLILTGVLAPLGVAIAAGTAATVAIAGASTLGAITIGAGANVVKNEIQLSNEIQNYPKQKQAYDDRVRLINDQRDDKLRKLDTVFEENSANFLKNKIENKGEISTKTEVHDVAQVISKEVELTDVSEATSPLPLALEAESLLSQLEQQIETCGEALEKASQVVVRAPIIASETPSKAKVVPQEEVVDEVVQQNTIKS
ncbi:hypothetical protein [Legionella maioricensis]|uniref:Uncharacterized protein n=1 Tax=Legionella maioricensis TaxID=2896528 RepID=A0A9X2IC99_9GAMM|nr:hypothetical protein [Legionella maioricensis]MCL9685699.1 hypothetical protein [Legionella maioricensis]MCL9689144.1 hypothetical protein [Legionella maioricensis]